MCKKIFESRLYEEATAIGKIGIWQFNSQDETIVINRKFSHYFQTIIDHSDDENSDAVLFKVDDFINTFHINHKGILKRLITNARDEKSSFDVSLQLLNEGRWLNIIGYPVKDENGDIRSIRGLFQDVTELMSTQLLALEYQNAIDSLSRLIVSKDFYELDNILSEALKLALEYLGLDLGIISQIIGDRYQVVRSYSPIEGMNIAPDTIFELGKTYCSLVRQSNTEVYIHNMGKSDYHEHPAYKEFQLESYIGIPLYIKGEFFGTLNFSSKNEQSLPITDLQKKFSKFLGKWIEMIIERHDLFTGIRENLRLIQEKENLFEAVFRENPNILILSDYDQNIVSVNTEFTRIFGYSEEEVLGLKILNLHDDEKEYQLERKKYLKKKTDEELLILEVKYLKKDGSTFIGKTVGTKIRNIEGDVIGFCAIITDLTAELEKTRLLNERNTELEREKEARFQSSKMVALGEMAGGVSHEINNPLTIIEGFSINLIRRFEKEGRVDIEKVKRSLEKILVASQRISKIVRGLKSFSRDDRMDEPIQFSIKELIEETMSFCEQRFTNNGVELEILIDREDVLLEGHPIQISQVLLNLLNNAFDAVYYNDDIVDKWIKFQMQKVHNNSSEWIEIRIIDAGKGIKKNHVKKLMNPFFTTKEVGKGTGLGLSISKGIIEKHDGQLGYELYNEHTSFYMKLPLSQRKNR